jgi:diguanylate cyclase (GGDEF)-like protein/PAS domain S-box-containing protein
MIVAVGALLGLAILAWAGGRTYRRLRSTGPSLDGPLFWDNVSPMWIYDPESLRFIAVNDAAIRRYGYSREEFATMTLRDIRPKEDVPLLVDVLIPQTRTSPKHVRRSRHVTRDGTLMTVEIDSHALTFRGRKARLVNAHDISAQMRAEARLIESQTSLESAQRLARLGSFAHDRQQKTHRWTEEVFRIYGVDPSADISEGLAKYDHPEDAARVRDEVMRAREDGTPYDVDHRIVRPSGEIRHVHEQGRWIYDDAGNWTHNIGTVLDITDRKRADEELARLAYSDTLTGLPNRAGLSASLAEVLQRSSDDTLTAVLFFDVDRFKMVNDTLGHGAGDQVLAEIGRRLRDRAEPGDLVCRPGGDEFIVVLKDARDKIEIARRTKALLDTFLVPVQLEDRDHFLTASVGVAIHPLDGRDEESLLRSPAIAMYAPKRKGSGTFHFYTSELQYVAARRFRLETALRHALERNEFTLLYQPLVESLTGRIAEVEALIRWNDPELGPTPPAEFIPFAEENGAILSIGAWVFREALLQAKRWHDSGDFLRVWINVSPSQLRSPNFVSVLGDTIRTMGVRPSLIGLELTESSFIDASAQTLDTLQDLKHLGVRLALDDFGVKYSSLEYLRRMPIDTLKIDRCFVEDVHENSFSQSIVRAIVNIGHDVGYSVSAEGVETTDQLEFLTALGCDRWQGHLFSEARPSSDIERLVRSRENVAATISSRAIGFTG